MTTTDNILYFLALTREQNVHLGTSFSQAPVNRMMHQPATALTFRTSLRSLAVSCENHT